MLCMQVQNRQIRCYKPDFKDNSNDHSNVNVIQYIGQYNRNRYMQANSTILQMPKIILKGKKQFIIKAALSNASYQANDKQCAICLDNRTNIILQCEHHFHNNCLSYWFQNKNDCPVCRAKIYKNIAVYCNSCMKNGVTVDHLYVQCNYICGDCKGLSCSASKLM